MIISTLINESNLDVENFIFSSPFFLTLQKKRKFSFEFPHIRSLECK